MQSKSIVSPMNNITCRSQLSWAPPCPRSGRVTKQLELAKRVAAKQPVCAADEGRAAESALLAALNEVPLDSGAPSHQLLDTCVQ